MASNQFSLASQLPIPLKPLTHPDHKNTFEDVFKLQTSVRILADKMEELSGGSGLVLADHPDRTLLGTRTVPATCLEWAQVTVDGVLYHVPLYRVGTSDPHWNNVVALLHFDGDLTEETGRTWIAITGPVFESGGVEGSAALSSAVYTPYDAELDLLNADFTVEFYVRSANWNTWTSDSAGLLPNAFGKMEHAAHTNYWSFGPNKLGKLAFYAYNNGSSINLSSTGAVPVGVLTHVALMRQGNQILMSVGGIVEVVGSVSTISLGGSAPFSVGKYNNITRVGLQDELRITKGVARYTENFTPPTVPFSNF